MTADRGPNLRLAAHHLVGALGPTLVAALAGAPDVQTLSDWIESADDEIRPAVAKRLTFAYETWLQVEEAEDADTARTWFMGMNPWLDDDTAITAIREGRWQQVSIAAKALIEETWFG